MSKNNYSNDSYALKAVAAQFIINGIVAGAFIPRLPEIRESLSLDLAAIGQLITAASIGGLVGSWACAHILSYYSTKQVLITGSIAFVLLLPCIALASTGVSLAIVIALILFVDVVVDIAVNMQGSVLSARRATPVMNRLHGVWSIGMVTGGLIATGMASFNVPLIWHLSGVSLMIALCLLYIGRGLLDSDEQLAVDTSNAPSNAQQSGDGQQGVEPGSDQNTPPAKSRRALLCMFAVLGSCAFIPEMALSDWSPFRFRDDLNTSEGLASLAYVLFGSGMVVGRMSGDWFAVKLGAQRALRYSIILAISGAVVACLVDYYLLSYLGLIVAGLGISVLFPSLYDAAARHKTRPAAMLGAMTAGSRLAGLFAPLLIGFLANIDNFAVGMAITICVIPCLLLTWMLYNNVSANKG